jgi:hypothetical protein
MTCPTCHAAAQLSANPASECLVDLTCAQCCVRHIMKTIETFGAYGGKDHAERIKDLLVERLIKEGQ